MIGDQLPLRFPPEVCKCLSHNGFLTTAGYAALDAGLELAFGGSDCYLDKVGSVSALEVEGELAVWDDQVLDEQYRRFLDVA